MTKETTIPDMLLNWYDRHARRLPWRALPGEVTEPYRVWLSEVMLQQTTVVTVAAYFERFTARWPTIFDLAAAELDDVLTEWAGLGYYARARNLHKCARTVVAEHNGVFPQTQPELEKLPGIGRYTSAAIASIAFDRPAAVMDGNIERVVSRLYAIETPLPDSKPELMAWVEKLTPEKRPGDYAQAMMDLGATVCVPGRAKCMICPLQSLCEGHGIAELLPRKKPKAKKPTRIGAIYWIERQDGAVLLRRRPESGLLGGMIEFPGTDWQEEMVEGLKPFTPQEVGGYPERFDPKPVGQVRHTFTHFHLVLDVYIAKADNFDPAEHCSWHDPARLGDVALPTVMRKVAKAVLMSAPKAPGDPK